MSEVIRLSEEDVLTVRRQMAAMSIAGKDAFGQVEPVDYGKFSSAVNRQFTSGGGLYKYKTLSEVSANLFYGVAMGHSFENGNKRTALVSMLVLLDRNKTLLVETSEDELYEMARQVAAHEFVGNIDARKSVDEECSSIAKWLNPRLRSLQLGERVLEFRELKETLTELGCEFGKPSRNYIKIKKGQWMVTTGYPRDKFDVPLNEIKRIRKKLRLDEAHGIDSASFYDFEAGVSKFVNQHRNLLRKLADL